MSQSGRQSYRAWKQTSQVYSVFFLVKKASDRGHGLTGEHIRAEGAELGGMACGG